MHFYGPRKLSTFPMWSFKNINRWYPWCTRYNLLHKWRHVTLGKRNPDVECMGILFAVDPRRIPAQTTCAWKLTIHFVWIRCGTQPWNLIAQHVIQRLDPLCALAFIFENLHWNGYPGYVHDVYVIKNLESKTVN